MSLEDKIKEVLAEFEREAPEVPFEQLKTKYVGREGKVRALFAELKSVPPDLKGAVGQQLNALKTQLEDRIIFDRHGDSFRLGHGQLGGGEVEFVGEVGKQRFEGVAGGAVRSGKNQNLGHVGGYEKFSLVRRQTRYLVL